MEDKLRELKKSLFDILVYIVEDTIKDDGVDKIIDKMIIPVIKQFALEELVPKEKKEEEYEYERGFNACREQMIKNIRGE